MSEQGDVARIVAECERYWRDTGVPRAAISDMALELRQHLEAATSEGRSPSIVVGTDLTGFAEAWASEHRRQGRTKPENPAILDRRSLIAYATGAIALVAGAVAGSLAAGGSPEPDEAAWRWVWTIFALVMGIGEIFTAGFFLLPFAVGAAAAAVLAWLGVAVVAQWLVFFGVSVISLAYLRRFIEHQDDADQPRVGANRWVDARGIVLEDIDPDQSRGLVRVENEEWRATAERHIPAGTRVIVRSVSGARLVVAPLEDC